jgi:tRNA pseudouridine55 synthase
MIYAFGKATRLLKYFIGLDKEYEVLLKFGFKSDTFDSDGEIVGVSDNRVLREDLEKLINDKFLGEIFQVPPKFSALKVSGKRASDLVREGIDVKLEARKVVIYSCDISDFDFPFVKLRIRCGSGTYIRSFVNDIGEALKVGAYVVELRRLAIGPFSIENSSENILSIEKFLGKMPKTELSSVQYEGIRNGKRLSLKMLELEGESSFAFFDGRFVGVLEKSGVSGVKLKKEM